MAETADSHAEAVEKLRKLIKGIRVAMLTTVEQDGSLRSRPMETQDAAKFDGTLWFFTSSEGGKVPEIQADHNVNVAYSDPDNNRYVSTSGKAVLVKDRQKMEELYTPALKAWFPDGLDDPNMALLRVTVEHAEYWDAAGSTIVKVAGFIKAVATGQTFEPGEHDKVKF